MPNGCLNFFKVLDCLFKQRLFHSQKRDPKYYRSQKNKLANTTLQSIDETVPFTVETDASDLATGETLNQNGRPIAFQARILNNANQKHSSVEKETYAVIEAF